MEPFEWLLLGAGLAIGSLLGSRGKGMMRTVAKGYLVAADTTRNVTANMREDFRDAVEEARYEREQEALQREQEQLGHDGLDDPALIHSSVDGGIGGATAHGVSTRTPRSTTSHTTSARSNKKSRSAEAGEPAT